MGNKNVRSKDMLIDHDKFLGKHENSLKIYNPPPRDMIISPFSLKFDAIDRLIVINFENDPIYFRIELQIIHKLDKDFPLVIMYRKDNMIDVYYTNQTVIKDHKERLTQLFAHTSFNQLEVIEHKFQFYDTGLDASLFFEDKLEREIEFKVKENNPERKLTSILVPMGVISRNPERFPIVYLNEFGMVLKTNTEIMVKIHGILRDTTVLPVKFNAMNVYGAQYSLDPIICDWNNKFSGNIDPIILKTHSTKINDLNIAFDLKNNSDYKEIKTISGRDEKTHNVSFEFSPAIPNLISLRSKKDIKGRFSCIIDETKGIFAGDYYLTRTGNIINFSITPTKGWQPFPGKLWLKTYKWISSMRIQSTGDIKIDSCWQRLKG